MNGQPESEQLQNFHERLSQWVSDQGFWFQLRYSLSGGGSRGALTFHFLRLLARVGVFVAVVAVGFWYYLANQGDTDSYRAKLNQAIRESFAAEEIQIKGFSRLQGEFSISRMALIGGEDTFFTGLEIRNLRCNMGLLDGLRKTWDPGLIEIARADISIRAGADSQTSSKAISDVLFQDTGRVKIDALQVNEMSIKWGYSERTRGQISGSKMTARRLADGWRLTFRGGTFSQNWLKRLEIEELDVVFGKQGLVFEKAIFKKGQGEVTMKDLKVKAGQRPEVSGEMSLRQFDISLLMPAALRGFVEGAITGDFKVFGSTNSSEGVGYEGNIILEGEDMIVLRDRIHLLRALSVVDAVNTYRRVDFRNGSFKIKSHAGRLTFRDVELSTSDDLMSLDGSMVVRLPTSEEALVLSDRGSYSETIFTEDELAEEVATLTLRSAAEKSGAAANLGFEKEDDVESLFERLGLNIQNRRIEELAAEKLTRSYRYAGKFTMTVKKDAFLRAPKLMEIYPASEVIGRIPIEVPLEGVLYDLTIKQADEIYKKGTR